jgi:ribosome-associated protein
MNINSENDNPCGLNATEIDLGNAIADDSDRVLIKRMLDLLSDEKAEKIVFIDAKTRSSLADYLLVSQGRSQLHCRSIAQNVEYNLKQEGEISLGLEGEREGNWVLLDYGNIILHVFHPEIRKYYKLEELYSKRPSEVYADSSEPSKYKY